MNAPGPLKNLQILTEDGYTYNLFGTSIHFVHLDGTGIPFVERVQQRSPLQHGATDRGFRIMPRDMKLYLMVEGDDQVNLVRALDRVSYIFSPTNSPIQLRAIREDGDIRQIDCYTSGVVDYPMSTRVGAGQPILIELVAPDPFWYDPTVNVDDMALTNGNNDIELDVTGMTWDEWPIIDITGPLDAGFELIRQPGDETIEFIAAVPDNDTIRIDLRPSYKTVRLLSTFANRMNFVDPDTLFSFSTLRILGEKTMKALDNSWANDFNRWRFVCAGTGANSHATITWYRRFISL